MGTMNRNVGENMATVTKHIILIMSIITKISKGLGHLSAGFVLVMTFIMGYDVLMRHVFNRPTIWVDELSGYLLVGITFLGAAYTLTQDAHIRIEIVVGKLGADAQRRLNYITDVLSFLFLVIYAWQGGSLFVDAYVSGKISSTLVRTPMYIPELAVLIGLTWLCFQMLIHFVNRVIEIHTKKEKQSLS